MSHPILYDATMAAREPDRAEPLDRMLVASLLRLYPDDVQMVSFGRRGPARVASPCLDAIAGRDQSGQHGQTYDAIRAWLLGEGGEPRRSSPRRPGRRPRHRFGGPGDSVAQGAVLLKVGLRGWEDSAFEAWLAHRKDVRVIAALREPWELDFPEYADAADAAAAERAWRAMRRRAVAIVALNDAAAARAENAIRLAPTPSELAQSAPVELDAQLAETPFLLQIGPIEARSNALLLLQIWRELARRGGPVPKLALIGRRGDQTHEIAPMLDWSETIRPHVFEAAGLRAEDLRRLIVHARAVLAPDFAAPDGSLLRDACALGVRTIVADVPAFRELAGPHVEKRGAIAGAAWRQAIVQASRRPARVLPDDVTLPSWADWTHELFAYLASI